MADKVLLDEADGILTITLSNPDVRNALTPDMMDGLIGALRDAARNPSIRVVILTGDGDMFCSGADVRALGKANLADPMARRFGDDPAWAEIEMRGDRIQQSAYSSYLLRTLPKPTISMIRGAAAGAGLGLALAPDFRFASDDAFFTTAFAKLGASGDFGAAWFLQRLVGSTKAKELLFLSDRVTAGEALDLGLVDRVYSADDLAEATRAFALKLAKGAPLAYRLIKENVALAEVTPLGPYLETESRNMARTLRSNDAAEGIQAFKERRSPNFSGS